MRTTIHLPAETKLTMTADAVTSGHYARLPGPGQQSTDYTAISASSTTTIGPFSEAREYLIVSDKGEITTSQTAEKFTPLNLTWPSADGTAGQALTTDGSGTLSFANAGSNGNIVAAAYFGFISSSITISNSYNIASIVESGGTYTVTYTNSITAVNSTVSSLTSKQNVHQITSFVDASMAIKLYTNTLDTAQTGADIGVFSIVVHEIP